MSSISHVLLELAREPGHPHGAADHGYHLYLPLDPDGRIDPRGFRALRAGCRVRRFRPGEPEARGRLEHGPGGSWVFDYDETRSGDDESGFRFDDERFIPGEYVSIREDDGRVHTFQVVSVRQE